MLYDYECAECGWTTEEWQGMHDEHRFDCKCGVPMRRVYTAPNIQGDTVAGGYIKSGYNEQLGEYVSSDNHRKEIMKRKGLSERHQGAAETAAVKEQAYICANGKGCKGEAKEEQLAAMNKNSNKFTAAMKEKKTKALRADFDKSIGKSIEQAARSL